MLFDALNAVASSVHRGGGALVQGTEMRQAARARPLQTCAISRIPTRSEDGRRCRDASSTVA
jgi:hypothetical protein